MKENDLVIINNEKVFKENETFYCDNLDLKILPEELNNYYNVQYIVRGSKRKGSQQINLKDIKIAFNFFNLFYLILKTLKKKDVKYLLISVTPFTFFSFLILSIFRKKVIIYLFSNGYEEYKYILGNKFVWVYHLMLKIVTYKNKVIVCHERLYDKKKSHLVYISRLDNDWLDDYKKAPLDKARFLYVGRMSREKGIFEFIEMFKKLNLDSQLSIAGDCEKYNFSNKNIKLLGYISNPKSLIKTYDEHNIMVLPSYTEATPYVLDETLSRRRPAIIFEDIAYIVRGKRGVFVTKRNIDSFLNTTKYIMENYEEIQKNMERNVLPTKNSMIKQISDIIKFKSS